MEILIATVNPFKKIEQAWYLEGLANLTIHYPNELPSQIEIDEDGQTLTENAIKKAVEISKITDWVTFTTDAGIIIPHLKNWDYRRPKRILAEDGNETAGNQKLIDLMSDLKGEHRRANYRLAIALARSGIPLYSSEYNCYHGYIQNALPDDPEIADILVGGIWHLPQFGQVEPLLTTEQRNQLRSNQVPQREKLQNYLKSLTNPIP